MLGGSRRSRRTLLVAALVATAGLAGCAADSTSTTDEPDDTQIETNQVSVSCPAGTQEYFVQRGGAGSLLKDDRWENPCPHARGFLQMGGAGVINLTVKDDDGEVVLTTGFSPYTGGRQEFQTSSRGTPGTWQIEITGAYAGGVQVSLSPTFQPRG